jgi:HAD superfamily hydrolase (TIGR01484 family)
VLLKGYIALDIDGTITSETHEVDQEVADAFFDLFRDGWKFIFITGRPFHWGYRTLHLLPFPYALAVQNGALLLQMPEKVILRRSYLTCDILPHLEEVSAKEQTDFVIYAGLELDDACFFRPGCLPPSILSYVMKRKNALMESYQSVDTFTNLSLPYFSSVKFFADREQAMRLGDDLEKQLGLHAPCNRDPFDSNYFVVQGTHADATKGGALRNFIKFEGGTSPIIAAGDDFNDVSMLREAHVKIVMENAPHDVLKMADIIAPHASRNGIIQGLLEAVHLVKRGSVSG